MKYLLDSNVLSEWWKPQPDSAVVAWLEESEWFIPAPMLAEMQDGAEAAPSQARRVQLNALLDKFMRDFDGLVIDWNAETSRTWGRLKHTDAVRNKPQALWDSLIDAMGVQYGLTVATRNTGDFRHAKTFNPWESKDVSGPAGV